MFYKSLSKHRRCNAQIFKLLIYGGVIHGRLLCLGYCSAGGAGVWWCQPLVHYFQTASLGEDVKKQWKGGVGIAAAFVPTLAPPSPLFSYLIYIASHFAAYPKFVWLI